MTLEEYNKLKDSGMMYELHPHFTGVYVTDTGKNLEVKDKVAKVCCETGEEMTIGCLHDHCNGAVPAGDWDESKIPKPTPAPPTGVSAKDSQVGGSHYKDLGIQPLEITYKNKGYKGFEGAAYTKVLKYISRDKDDLMEDLDKAIHIIEFWKEVLEEEESS